MLGLYWTVWDRSMQVLYRGRALRTKETLPYFLKWRRVTRHPLVFRGLTGSQRTLGFGASHEWPRLCQMSKIKKRDTLGINGKVNDNKTKTNSDLILQMKGDQNVSCWNFVQKVRFL